jgi:uncharacterized protein Veg
MRTIYEAKKYILDRYNKNIVIKVSGIRNKSEIVRGKITEYYKNVFVIDSDNFKRCFSYKDLLLGIIKFIDK